MGSLRFFLSNIKLRNPSFRDFLKLVFFVIGICQKPQSVQSTYVVTAYNDICQKIPFLSLTAYTLPPIDNVITMKNARA